MHICNISAAAYPVHVWGARDQACVHLCSFHHYEPWLCWAHWAARQLESSVSSYCHDGARLWWADLSVPSVLIISGSGMWRGGSNFGVNQSKNSVVNLMHLWMTEVISRKGLLSTLLFIYWQFVIQQTEGMYLIQIPFEDPLTYYLVLSKHTFFFCISLGLIAEVILYSEGFESSKNLAQKMVQMYKLCSEQLSQQDHYDFGMRAVKSVLVMAGSLKRQNPDKSEDVVLIRALRDSNLPKFLKQDAVLFQVSVTGSQEHQERISVFW